MTTISNDLDESLTQPQLASVPLETFPLSSMKISLLPAPAPRDCSDLSTDPFWV
jgi:hypothetical protein